MQHVKHTFTTSARQKGFTLFELLIASIIFAIMAMMAYGGLDNVLDNSEASQQALQRLQQLQQTVSVLNRDFSQMINRSIRDEYGNEQPPLAAGNNIDNLVEFTRGGRVNPANLARSSLLRVSYRFDDEKLVRLQWPQLDREQNAEPKETMLIDNLETVTLRFLDKNGEWREQWPPLNTAQQSAQTAGSITPAAIEIVLKLKDWGDIRRLYAMN